MLVCVRQVPLLILEARSFNCHLHVISSLKPSLMSTIEEWLVSFNGCTSLG